MTINKIRENIEAIHARSAWGRGVKLYAYELIDSLEEAICVGCFAKTTSPRQSCLIAHYSTVLPIGHNIAGADGPWFMMKILRFVCAPLPSSRKPKTGRENQTLPNNGLTPRAARCTRPRV